MVKTRSLIAALLLIMLGVAGVNVLAPGAEAQTRHHECRSGYRWCPLTPVPTPTVSPTPTPTPGPGTWQQAYEARIAELVNTQRANAGLPSLKISSCATTYAENWSAHMASTAAFQHQDLSPIMYSCNAHGAGENIAYGNVTADQMMTMWMNSPGHRANILGSYTHIGVGASQTNDGRVYGTQDFLNLG